MLDTAPWNLLDTWFDTRWLDTACHAFNTGAWDLVPPAYAEEGYDIIPEGFDRFPNGAIDPAVQQLALLVTIFSLLPTPGMLPKRWFGDGDEGDVSRTEGSRTEGSRTEGGVSRRKADPSRRRAKGGRGGRPKMRAPHEDEGECSSSPSLQASLSQVVSQALTHVSHTRLSHTSLTHVSHKPLTSLSHPFFFSFLLPKVSPHLFTRQFDVPSISKTTCRAHGPHECPVDVSATAYPNLTSRSVSRADSARAPSRPLPLYSGSCRIRCSYC